MTPEEAIKIIKSECYVANLMNLDRTRMVNSALDVAIQALEYTELNPSYNSVKTELDCVSREAVQDLIAKLLSDYLHDEDREKIENVNAEIGELPSVTPQKKRVL